MEKTSKKNLKIISWNTNGLRATVKQGNFFPLLDKYKPDIFCLQETKSEADQLTDEIKNPRGYTSVFDWSKGRKGYSGVAIYSKIKPDKVIIGIGKNELDQEGRTVTCIFGKLAVITCYFPNGGQGPHRLEYKLAFYDQFLKFTEKLRRDYDVIFCGDVNTAHTAVDLARPKENAENTGFLPIERAWIDKVIAKKYIDTFRHLHPNTIDAYTYWDQKTRARDRNVGWRIDYFFVTDNLKNTIKDSYMLTDYIGSDHCPIVLELQ
jgi:exodeoxyribonuclease-3